MTLVILPRSAWGAVAPKRRSLLAPERLEGVTVHWFGKPKAAASHAGCDDLLRGVQRGHMAPGGLGVPSGGADIGYNHAVCPHGFIYELRGFGVKTGANGSADGNQRHAAIVYMAGRGDPLTESGKLGLNFLISEWRAKGAGTEVSPHRRWTGSECPGAELLSWLAAGRPVEAPSTEEPLLDPRFPIWFDWYLNGRPEGKARPASTNGLSITQPMWDTVDVAAAYRASKPDDDADVAALQAKIDKAREALA